MAERKTLVLVPGLLCDARLWEPQRQALGGLADILVADMTRQSSIAEMAEAVLAATPARFALAGLSMGGYVAMETALRAPERIERLALLDTRAGPDAPDRTAAREAMLRLADQGRFQGVTRRLLPALIHRDRLDDDALTATVMAMARSVGREAFLRQMRAIMARRDFRPHLAGIRCPTLVLCGREDARTPPDDSEAIAAAIPDARLVIVERCGHLSTLERPEAVNAALRGWLEKDAGPSAGPARSDGVRRYS